MFKWQPQLKMWIDYRFEEMEEKAGVTPLPEFDMDGCRFVVDEEDWETNQRHDAYVASISNRLMTYCDSFEPCGSPV